MNVWKSIRVTTWVLGPIALFCAWYAVAADYDYGMVAGVYQFKQHDEESMLVLKGNRTFTQNRNRNGKTERVQGEWHRAGEGGIDFSKEFLEISDVHPESDGFTYGQVRKTFLELIPYIVLGPDREHGPRFKRVFFHSGDIAQ